jgi:hypothetical protein
MELLAVLQTELSKDQRMEIVSSGSPVEPGKGLALTLRILGGGSHHNLTMPFSLLLLLFMLVFMPQLTQLTIFSRFPGCHSETQQNCKSWQRA